MQSRRAGTGNREEGTLNVELRTSNPHLPRSVFSSLVALPPSLFPLPSSLLLLLAIAGCGGDAYPLASVSGTVTLDGVPLAEALISFEPVRQGEDPDSGPGSYGKTDQQGRFSLKSVHGEEGAVIGTHVVRITTSELKELADVGQGIEPSKRIPRRYIDGSALRFTVPAGGTDQADFALTSN